MSKIGWWKMRKSISGEAKEMKVEEVETKETKTGEETKEVKTEGENEGNEKEKKDEASITTDAFRSSGVNFISDGTECQRWNSDGIQLHL